MSDETPVERRLRDIAKRMRRIFDAEPEAATIDRGREAIRLLRDYGSGLPIASSNPNRPTRAVWNRQVRDLLARCREGA